jgi:hypothetical protein
MQKGCQRNYGTLLAELSIMKIGENLLEKLNKQYEASSMISINFKGMTFRLKQMKQVIPFYYL